MILIESASGAKNIYEQTSLLAHSLQDAGIDARLDAESRPKDLPSTIRYEVAPLLIDAAAASEQKPLEGLVLVDCNNLSHACMATLHRLTLAPDAPVIAIGAFNDKGRSLSATAQIAYATGRTPHTIDLADHPLVHATGSAIPCLGTARPRTPWPPLRGREAVQIFAPEIAAISGGLQVLLSNRSIAPMVYTSSKEKAAWLNTHGPGAHIKSYGEVLPSRLAAMGRILVLTGPVEGNYRGLAFFNCHLAAGSVIIDATPDGSFMNEGLPILRGPADLGYLPAYLRETILPNIEGLTEMAASQNAAGRLSLSGFFEDTGLVAPASTAKPATAPAPIAKDAPDVWFMPTNGHGLGHAQRCTLIAEALRNDLPKSDTAASGFLAFPSCLGMIRARGFDAVPLVSRSNLHLHSTANDELNFDRVRTTLSPGNTLVFDGGYVFDSVTRTILEHDLAAVWIRRGLWTAAQDNTIPLDRERYFTRVITPREGLEELNRPVSGGEMVRDVGPIVRLLGDSFDRDALRAALAERYGEFDELIVTMLGSGVYLDISTQLQMVSAFAESRPGCLNLIVVWPSSKTPAARFVWNNSRVVATRNATALAGAADVVVSAAGYNSFHESLYNRVPTIFVPQVATWLDDQIARAELAAEKGLAGCITPERPGRITRELSLFLDRGKAAEAVQAMSELELPEPGTVQAARLIAEMSQ